MKRTQTVLILTIVLSLSGMLISYNLLVKHQDKATGLAWFDSTCESGDDTESNRSCDEVMASPWGTFPPVPSNVAPEKRYESVSVLGLFQMRPQPVALFGMFYFSAMAAWYLAIGRPSYKGRLWHLVPIVLNVLGVLGAVFFSYIMFFTELQAWCPWCMVTHVCNGLMLIGTLLLWPRTQVEYAGHSVAVKSGEVDGCVAIEGCESEPALSETPRSPVVAACSHGSAGEFPCRAIQSTRTQPITHPSRRLIAVTLVGVAALTIGEWYHYVYGSEVRARQHLRTAFDKLDSEMEHVRNHAKTMYSMFAKGEKKDILIRDDDPVKNPGTDRLQAVVISDFRCPHCSGFAKYIAEVVEPMFGDALSITFKHFPADTTCNRRIRKTLHAKACEGSEAVEAARMLGGTEAFWRAHDLLFESQNELRDDRFYAQLPEKLGLDKERFAEAMNSQTVRERIAEDIDLAVNIGLRGTPAVYVGGRQVPSMSREQDVFWNEVKRRYMSRLRQRPGKTAGKP